MASPYVRERHGRLCRALWAIVGSLTVSLALISAALAEPAAAGARVAKQQLVAVLTANEAVRATPNGRRIAIVLARRPLTGGPTVLPVLSRTADRSGRTWLRVRLPGRTLGTRPPPASGWINAAQTQLRVTLWHIVVDLGSRTVTVYDDGHSVRRFSAIVGKPSTPTQPGQYFVEEDVILSNGQPGGPFALATSDRSAVLKEFDGGPGQIAIHGLQNLGGRLGTAESHGCVRLANKNITWLAKRVGAGTPITIS